MARAHQTHRWNPKMDRYIFGSRSNIHIIDLSQTIPLLHQALVAVREVAAKGGRVLFVGTKRQAADPVAEAAQRCAQYYMNNRWLGGTLTNWRTVSGSIARLRELEGLLEGGGEGRVKKELLNLQREKDKLELSLGGIKDMGGIPDIMFVIDTNKEAIAILEARKLNIPIIAILDTNSDPDGITYPIPGNDDAARAIQTYCDLIADAVLDGLAAGAASSGVDLGAAVNPDEPMLREAKAPKAKAEDAAPAGTEAVAEEMIAAAEAPAAEEPPVADEAAKEATSEANDAVETEPAQV
ncbi:MAG: 30S ribosomal protein S2 [Caulobacterales bacterium]|nr:30S ribosomal protein S2 [Caulobacterales bacterium]